MVDLDDLVSARIIVARLGLLRIQDIHQARKRSGFPEPVKKLSRTSVWLWSEVRAWAVGGGWVGLDVATTLTRRVMLEPDDLVEADVIADRLGLPTHPLNTALIEDLDPVGGNQDDRRYRWGDAEQLWQERANRGGSSNQRTDQ